MLLASIGYRELNKADPDCGTTFTWASRAFGPKSGWARGWAIIVADVLVMASALTTNDEADALSELGWVRRLTGDYAAAAADQRQALDLFLRLGDRLGQARALASAGHHRARRTARRALSASRLA